MKKAMTMLARMVLCLGHWLVRYLPAERAHRIFVYVCLHPWTKPWFMRTAHQACASLPKHPATIGGLAMDCPIGIAAGFDKNGELIEPLLALGFGFVEVGTVTPKPQLGNPKPRIWKWQQAKAIVNAMGFNNDGLDVLVSHLTHVPVSMRNRVLVSISKNTSSNEWLPDITQGMQAVWHLCGGMVINLSSPNSPGLRTLQNPEVLQKIGSLYDACKTQLGPSALVPSSAPTYPLLACKLSPDLPEPDMTACLDAAVSSGFGAVVLTNTTSELGAFLSPSGKGGLSGLPLREKANHMLSLAARHLNGRMPIMGVGGILTPKDATTKWRLGASAIQIYSGFVFHGPRLLWDIRTTDACHCH